MKKFFKCDGIRHLQLSGIGVLSKFLPLVPIDADEDIRMRWRVEEDFDNVGILREELQKITLWSNGCIVTKLEQTQLTSIALSVFVMNLFKIQKNLLNQQTLHILWEDLRVMSLQSIRNLNRFAMLAVGYVSLTTKSPITADNFA